MEFANQLNAPAGILQLAKLARAKTYPYSRPNSSFIFCQGDTLLLSGQSWWQREKKSDSVIRVSTTGEERRLGDLLQEAGLAENFFEASSVTPILALGSNGSPEQLARKFPTSIFPAGTVIPVRRAVLQDFDVAYAPVIAAYGSCAATLVCSPGSSVEVAITYLSPAQLEHMHRTEGSYNLVRLDYISLHLCETLESYRLGGEEAEVLDSVLLYIHQLGALRLPGSEQRPASAIALQEIRASDRNLPAKQQVVMLEAIMGYLQGQELQTEESAHPIRSCLVDSPPIEGLSAEETAQLVDLFILENVEDAQLRATRNSMLALATLAFEFPHTSIISQLSDTHV